MADGLRLGIIGYGAIAQALIALLPANRVSQVTVLVRPGAHRVLHTAQGPAPQFVTTLDALLAENPDLVVECAGHGAVAQYGMDVLRAGCDLMLVSVGALADDGLHNTLRNAAQSGHAKIILPSGAIAGLDQLPALALAGDLQVTYTGTKPPAAWAGTPAESQLDLTALTQPQVFFTGTARQAAKTYPKNANVVAALALAGAGFDQTRVELVADPGALRNTHAFHVASPLCTYDLRMENVAAPGNARTSLTTVYSVLHKVLTHR